MHMNSRPGGLQNNTNTRPVDMVVIVSPVVPITTKDNLKRFFSLLRDVADETLHHEPDCLGYCWLISTTADSTAVRGLEIYKNEEALTISHRAGQAYQKFRHALQREQLAPPPRPENLNFWRDTEWKVQHRGDERHNLSDSQCVFSTTEYKVDGSENMEALLSLLKSNSQSRECLDLLLCIVSTSDDLQRVLIVEVYSTEEAYRRKPTSHSGKISELVQEANTATWKPCGVGFLR